MVVSPRRRGVALQLSLLLSCEPAAEAGMAIECVLNLRSLSPLHLRQEDWKRLAKRWHCLEVWQRMSPSPAPQQRARC